MAEYEFPFEKLEVWQEARRFVKQVYDVTKRFPGEEKFGLANQLNRAVVSVASNLAEGCSRVSLKDQAHFSQLAYSSLMEVACQLTLASDVGFIQQERYDALRSYIAKLTRKINALRTSQLARGGRR